MMTAKQQLILKNTLPNGPSPDFNWNALQGVSDLQYMIEDDELEAELNDFLVEFATDGFEIWLGDCIYHAYFEGDMLLALQSI